MLPAAAQADRDQGVPVPASDALASSAHALAVARWGVEPCGGQGRRHLGPHGRRDQRALDVDERSTSTNRRTYSQCSIAYNLDVDWDWPKLCTVIEHELGHLAGHEHVNDPHNVMSPYYVFPTPECAGAPPGAQPAPAEPRRRRSDAVSDDSGERGFQAQGRQAQGGQARDRQGEGEGEGEDEGDGQEREGTKAARAKKKAARSRSRAHGAAAANR